MAGQELQELQVLLELKVQQAQLVLARLLEVQEVPVLRVPLELKVLLVPQELEPQQVEQEVLEPPA